MSRFDWKAIATGAVIALVGNIALGLVEGARVDNATDEASSLSLLLVALRFATAFVCGYVAGRISVVGETVTALRRVSLVSCSWSCH
jgi:hypothetical protein